MAQTHQPAYRAFTVVKREGQDDFWLPIGAAFAHEKGDGFNVILQALPISAGDGTCKIVLRPTGTKPTAPSRQSATKTIAAKLRGGNTQQPSENSDGCML
jgi:hypothetical protein